MEWLIPCAFALDLAVGDPRAIPHPVVLIGRLISRLENVLVRFVPGRRLAGVFLTALTLLAAGMGAWLLLAAFGALGTAAGWLASLWIAATTLALRSLHQESRTVVDLVESGDIQEARGALSLIVGRDTASLDEEGVLRACIETVAENTSDGIVAPLFYLFVGGPVGAILFKAASTLDSMVGYRNERYRELGWASARLDDLLNLVPARLTGLLMALSAFSLRLDGRGALRIMSRDARKHSSPNAGFPEAALAGALGVQLGGMAVYFGKSVKKPTLGEALRPVTVKSYRDTIRLMYLTSILTLALGLLAMALLRFL